MFDDVSVNVIGGTAVLVGYLTTSQKLPPLIELVARTPGVQQVVSQMEILPDPPSTSSCARRSLMRCIATRTSGTCRPRARRRFTSS